MSNMMDATERGRPAMQYIRELETKLRACRQIQGRFRAVSFGWGYAAGVLTVLTWLAFFHSR